VTRMLAGALRVLLLLIALAALGVAAGAMFGLPGY
jgi:hypothetical protein